MTTKLHDSFRALYAALEVPRIARRVVLVLLLIHTGLLAYSAYVHSPTLNEPGHLVAGLSNWKFGRFEVYRVNPPLVKMVAALPVMAVGYNEDWSGFYEGPGARPEMGMGEDFVAANGERSFFLFMIARWACIPFSWIGAIVCYLWARDLYGRPSGVLACTIWCFEPNILAHASLMTPDAHATALGLAACYTFWRWLKMPTWTQAALTGVVLGLAELAKTTLILFYPLWPLMWLIYRWPDRHSMFGRDWLREAGMIAVRMVIGLYVLNLGYGFEGSFRELKGFHFVSNFFTGSDSPSPSGRGQGEGSPNRFANTWLGELPVPFPKNYLLGVDQQQSDFESHDQSSYWFGKWHDHGWWYYYLYACAIKVPLGLWAAGVLALLLSLRERPGECAFIIPRPLQERPSDGRHSVLLTANSEQLRASARDEFILLLPALVIFTVVSSKTGINEHMRYVLPAFPYMFIAISKIAKPNCLTSTETRLKYRPLRIVKECRVVFHFSTLFASILISWLISSSLSIYPHSLSYFNEFIRGPLNGSEHLLGSNVDWGQDLRYLQWCVEKHQRRETPGLAYHRLCSPELIGVTFVTSTSSKNGAVREKRKEHYGTSANLMQTRDVHLFREDSVGDLRKGELCPRLGKSLREYVIENCGYTIDILQLPMNFGLGKH